MAQIVPIEQPGSRRNEWQSSQSQNQNPNPSQDPLFEALAKYVTSGPGPSDISAAEIEDMINAHVNQPGGRAYLESLASINEPGDVRRWKYHATASGSVSTNLKAMTIVADTRQNNSIQQISFKGTCQGFFPQQVFTFEDGTLYWDELTDNMTVTIKAQNQSYISTFTVEFTNPIGKLVGELLLQRTTLHLPPESTGGGEFRVVH